MKTWLPLIFVFLFGCSRSPSFRSEEGRFSIAFPDPPKVNEDPGRTTFLIQKDGFTYAVILSDVPYMLGASAVEEASFLEMRARSSAEDMWNAKIKSQTIISLGRYPGLDVFIPLPKFDVRAKIFLVNGREYTVFIACPISATHSREVESFFDSFVLWD